MKPILLAFGLASLAIALALIAGAQLPNSALPVVLGVLAGIAASLPTSLLIVWRVTKAPPPRPAPAPAAERQPTIIVVPPAPPVPQAAPATPAAPAPASAPPGLVHETRASTIIGGRDET